MAVFLVAPELDLRIKLPVPEPLLQALEIQWGRLEDAEARDAFGRRLAPLICALIPDTLDWDIKEPTAAQVAFAMDISKKLGVPLPSEVLRFRKQMHEFLEMHAPTLKSRARD